MEINVFLFFNTYLILFLAEKDQSIPNPNPLTKVSLVPYQKALVDVQANGAIYQEIVTQLELAKVTHRNKTPLIQIIDKPTLPLENSRLRFFECIVYGLFGGFVISIIYFSFSNVISKNCLNLPSTLSSEGLRRSSTESKPPILYILDIVTKTLTLDVD